MSKLILIFIIIFVAINATFMFIYFNKPSENIQQTTVTNKTQESQQETSQEVSQQPSQNESLNESSIYESNCIRSATRRAENIENITKLIVIETRIFDKKNDVTYYLSHNWSNTSYDIKGMEKDVIDKTVVSIADIESNRGRKFTLPILCDINGNIGNYSSCLLNNIPDIPSACFNFTINLTECEIEWRDYNILDDIQYWVNPPGAALVIGGLPIENKTKEVFNFTILSSRNRLEYFGMNIIERTFSPIITDDVIFSSNKMTPDGKGGSIIREVNITNRTNVEFYATIWFKKKCYDKYVIY